MERRIWLWVIVGILVLGNLYLFLKTGEVSAASSTGSVVQSATSGGGASYGGMVGGC